MATTFNPILHLGTAATGHLYMPTYPNVKYAGNGLKHVAHLDAVSMETAYLSRWFYSKKCFFPDNLSLCAKSQDGNKKCTIQPKFVSYAAGLS